MKRALVLVAALAFAGLAHASSSMVIRRTVAAAAGGGGGGDGCSAAGTAISTITTSAVATGPGTQIIINYPPTKATGDLVIAHIHYEDDTATINTPTGWTLIAHATNTTTTPDSHGVAFYKVMTGSDLGKSTFTFSGSVTYIRGVQFGYRNFNTGCTAGPIEPSVATSSFSATTAWNVTGITTTHDGSRSVVLQDNYDSNPVNEPTGYLERFESSANNLEWADKTVTTAGATGALTGAGAGSSTSGTVIHFGIID